MPGIPSAVAKHSLNIMLSAKPDKQRLCHFDKEKYKAVGKEITKLLAAGFIKEVFHPDWLANPILIKKKNGKWMICVDYTSLNKSCLKDQFHLPRIDLVVVRLDG
jgi:hypothetical protein